MPTIRFFTSANRDIRVTEFGYSAPHKPRVVGPWVRDTYILHYILNDTCHFSGFDAVSGEAFLIAKDKLHSFSVQPGYRHYWIAFDGEAVSQILSKYDIPVQAHTHFQVAHREAAETILHATFKAAEEENGEAAVHSALFALLPLLELKNAPITHPMDNRMHIVADFLETHYSSFITMEQVAKTVHLSEKYVCKCFKAQYGVPPQRYLLRVRMERAKSLLKTTDLQITEIAKSVGYASPLVFSTAFKQYAGVSPSLLRK